MEEPTPTGVTGDSGAGEGVTSGGGGGFECVGDFVGPYKLMSVLGEGGFGTVWLAERREPMVQRVALKIIKPGMDSRSVIARFEQERQALAVMDHPNVARVFDGGVTERGRPYFVMEHVQGEPITAFCDRHTYTIRQRLELFIPVCEAVQHAHMKGIIHRDIKPSNVLVSLKDGNAIVKVIDFGIAKAISHTMTDKTIFTETGQLIGTPEYMSPEQAEMGATDIDTRTDVYSLGVVLYELLVGALPFDAKELRARGYAEIQRIIREVEPPTPSKRLTTIDEKSGAEISRMRQEERHALTRLLRSELEWIPLKAMRKDRRERYRGPDDLADDVRAFLEGRPLAAGPERAGYRVRKYVRRHRGPVFAGSAVATALVLGIGGTTWQMLRANDKAEEATQAAAREGAALAKETEARNNAENAMRAERAARETIEHHAYVANIQMAGEARENQQWDRLRERLEACPEHLRGWEWGWLDADSDGSLVTLRGHSAQVVSAEFSGDETRIVTASQDHTARVWDAVTGVCLSELRGHSQGLLSASFSPDGHRIVTASLDDTMRVWDAASGESVAEFQVPFFGRGLAVFDRDGTRIAAASGVHSVSVWDATTGARVSVLDGKDRAHQSVSYSPDGDRILTLSDDHTLQVWQVDSATCIAEMRDRTSRTRHASFSPDGSQVVSASTDGEVRTWDAASGEMRMSVRDDEVVMGCSSFFQNGLRIGIASREGTIHVRDGATGDLLGARLGHYGWRGFATFSPSGKRIVAGFHDDTARVWDAAITEHALTLSGGFRTLSGRVSLSEDGRWLVTGSEDGAAHVWDVLTDLRIATLRGHRDRVESVAFSASGSRMVTASNDATARVWDVERGICVAELRGHSSGLNCASFSTDGRHVVTASDDRSVRVWDAESGSLLAMLENCSGEVISASFGSDDTRIVVVTDDGGALIWNGTAGGSCVELVDHGDEVRSAQWNPAGTRVATASDDGVARIWDSATGDCLRELRGHTEGILQARYSHDGARIVTASRDGSARVWDASTGVCVSSTIGHTGFVLDAAFGTDGFRIVTASSDRSACVWDTLTGSRLAELQGHAAPILSCMFSSDGSRIITVADNNAIRIWDSVSYRERYPKIKESRDANARMRPLVDARIEAGDAVQDVRVSMLADGSLTERERAAVMWITTEYMEQE